MTITLYVNWDSYEIYRDDEALVEGYLDYHGGRVSHFNEYLSELYEPDVLFYADEVEKKEILKDYNADVLKNAKDWAVENNMKQEIKI